MSTNNTYCVFCGSVLDKNGNCTGNPKLCDKNQVRYCGKCGNKRERLDVVFCLDCGESFKDALERLQEKKDEQVQLEYEAKLKEEEEYKKCEEERLNQKTESAKQLFLEQNQPTEENSENMICGEKTIAYKTAKTSVFDIVSPVDNATVTEIEDVRELVEDCNTKDCSNTEEYFENECVAVETQDSEVSHQKKPKSQANVIGVANLAISVACLVMLVFVFLFK